MALAASITLQRAETTEEEPMLQRMESHVRGGRTFKHGLISNMWVIITTAETHLGVMRYKYGASLANQLPNGDYVQFPSVLR